MKGVTITICEGCDMDYAEDYPDYFQAEYPEVYFIHPFDCMEFGSNHPVRFRMIDS